eukprot:2379295-Rhodomonas_salina.1
MYAKSGSPRNSYAFVPRLKVALCTVHVPDGGHCRGTKRSPLYSEISIPGTVPVELRLGSNAQRPKSASIPDNRRHCPPRAVKH